METNNQISDKSLELAEYFKKSRQEPAVPIEEIASMIEMEFEIEDLELLIKFLKRELKNKKKHEK